MQRRCVNCEESGRVTFLKGKDVTRGTETGKAMNDSVQCNGKILNGCRIYLSLLSILRFVRRVQEAA